MRCNGAPPRSLKGQLGYITLAVDGARSASSLHPPHRITHMSRLRSNRGQFRRRKLPERVCQASLL